MSIPDFTRAEYVQPQTIEGEVVGLPLRRPAISDLPLAIAYGAAAALIGSLAYGMIASLGVMISIVTIGIGWLVARAMMSATGGIGGRPFQIAAVILTYFASTLGEMLRPMWLAHQEGLNALEILLSPTLWKNLLVGPFLELSRPFNGALGLLIIFIGLRTAWRLAAGSPGFGNAGGPRMSPFGPR